MPAPKGNQNALGNKGGTGGARQGAGRKKQWELLRISVEDAEALRRLFGHDDLEAALHELAQKSEHNAKEETP